MSDLADLNVMVICFFFLKDLFLKNLFIFSLYSYVNAKRKRFTPLLVLYSFLGVLIPPSYALSPLTLYILETLPNYG